MILKICQLLGYRHDRLFRVIGWGYNIKQFPRFFFFFDNCSTGWCFQDLNNKIHRITRTKNNQPLNTAAKQSKQRQWNINKTRTRSAATSNSYANTTIERQLQESNPHLKISKSTKLVPANSMNQTLEFLQTFFRKVDFLGFITSIIASFISQGI